MKAWMDGRLVDLFFAGIGLIFVVLCVAARPTVPDGWTVTTGAVVGFVTVDNSDSPTKAVVEYEDRDGVPHRLVSNVSFGFGLGDKLGDRITVAYNPARPAQGKLLSGASSWGWLIGAGVGALFAVLGGVMFLRQLRSRRQETPSDTALPGAIASGPLVETPRLAGFGYVFPRARSRLWLDIVIAPAMAIMFGAFAVVLFSQGGWLLLLALVAVAAALLLVTECLFDLRRGLFAPAAEVGPGGIWLRGVGRFAWADLAEVRHERFAGPAGEQGLMMYDRLALVPRDPDRRATRGETLAIRFANGFYGAVMPLAGRRPIRMTALGLMGFELADFAGLLARVREYFPVTDVSDVPVAT